MTDMPPTPAIEHLPTVFRRIRGGEYRVPPFQREFIWDEKQVLELLESVYRGYPIGSALLWKVEKKVFKSVKDQSVGFPLVPERYPASFVLDGVQRLSTLNGVFNKGSVVDDRRLDVHFDLIEERFLNKKDLNDNISSIPLQTVFRPKEFLDEQKRLSEMQYSDLLLERAVTLLTRFQEYLVPTVTIFDNDPQNVISIFQIVNSTGIRLGVVDFMRALTWSDDFDLSSALIELQGHFEVAGFVFDDELLLKALGITMGLPPLPDTLLALRGTPAEVLGKAVDVLRLKLDEVVDFVNGTIGIVSAQALPYEAQWLFLFRLRCENVNLGAHYSEVLAWIRTTSFTESLQGRPDHALVRMIDDLTNDIKSGRSLRSAPVHLSTDDVLFKRFLRGKAMTIAYLQGLIQHGIFEEIPVTDLPYDKFIAIFDREEIYAMFGREAFSARTIGNVIYMPHFKQNKGSCVRDAILSLYSEGSSDQLQAQYVDDEFIEHLSEGNFKAALIHRAQRIILMTPLIS